MKEISKEDLYWLAGLLEGEGCFHWAKSNSPLISLAMSDLDIVEKAQALIGSGKITISRKDDPKRKIMYRYKIFGKLSINWMKLLYPLMGVRRRNKINEILELWKNRGPRGLDKIICPRGHDISSLDNYYLQGNYKICKICNITRSQETTRKNSTEEGKLRKLERNAIKALAANKGISLEEAKKLFCSIITEGVN